MLGRLYSTWWKYDRSKLAGAEVVLNEAIVISPGNQQGYLFLSQVMLYQSRVDEAAKLIQKAYDLYPDNPQSQSALEEIKKIQ